VKKVAEGPLVKGAAVVVELATRVKVGALGTQQKMLREQNAATNEIRRGTDNQGKKIMMRMMGMRKRL
jgi:hypothetical protein